MCETEDRAVLAHLGVSQQEVDAIYNVAASSGSTVAELFAPGVGKGLRQTADAVKELVNPQPPKKKAGKDSADACHGCHGGRAWYRISYPYARTPWPDMPTEVPEWAKSRPTQSEARFLKQTAGKP